MYWLLLPVDANAQRHLVDARRPQTSFWTRVWAGLVSKLSSRH